MSTLLEPGRTYIRKLHATLPESDRLGTELKLGRALSQLDLQPRALPPSAILCIRSLRDPMPRAWGLEHQALHPPPAWEQAVAARVEGLANRAARPAHEAVPANAQAVVFADPAELLACLASDWCEGSVLANWWWRGLFQNADVTTGVRETWLAAPEYIPAALQFLSASGAAVAFVRKLGESGTVKLLESVVHRFGLVELQAALDIALKPGGRGAGLMRAPGDRLSPAAPLWQNAVPLTGVPGDRRAAQSTTTVRDAPPWRHWVEVGSSTGLAAAQQSFYGIGLMLHRAPNVVRTSAFARAWLEWHMELHEVQVQATTIHATSEPETVRSSRTSRLPPTAAPVSSAGDEQPPTLAALNAPAAVPARIETEFGGLFYLVNLALFLELYGDFTMPRAPGLALSPWDWVALVGREFLGERIESDPIWPLLAQLAGRGETEPPGHDFDPPDEWHLPVEWLKPFPQQAPWQQTEDGGRMRQVHPAGFVVRDVPIHAAVPHDQPARLARWLGWLVPYLRARLYRALACDEPGDLRRIVFEHHAQVLTAAAHLDIIMALAGLPIEIRYAGLDRDPGWVPAAGRAIAFHFE